MTVQPQLCIDENDELFERVDPRWGEDYCHGQVAFITPDGIHVWMHRKGLRVRFFDARAKQHGPEHANVYPAEIWAAAHAWIDPANPTLSLACIAEVRGQMREREAMGKLGKEERVLLAEIDAGAWDPRSSSSGEDRWKNPSPPASIQVDRGDKTPTPPSDPEGAE